MQQLIGDEDKRYTSCTNIVFEKKNNLPTLEAFVVEENLDKNWTTFGGF